MDVVLSDCTSEVIEFLPTKPAQKRNKVTDACVATDPEPPSHDKFVETNLSTQAGTQTEYNTTAHVNVDERKLADWLCKIFPAVEEELLKGPTPLGPEIDDWSTAEELPNIQTYQKISLSGIMENSQGVATWLSVHTQNAPILVVSSRAPHDDWCDHLQQTLKLYVPQRMPSNAAAVVYTEVKSVPLKACLSCLSTCGWNKCLFAGSTMDGDIHVWLCRWSSSGRAGVLMGEKLLNEPANGMQEIEEMGCVTSSKGYAVALDWLSETRLLSFHENGVIQCWSVGKELILENDFQLKLPHNATNEITAAICLSSSTFAVGLKDGAIFLCTINSFNSKRKQLEMVLLMKQLFMITTLLKTQIDGRRMVISCDLSGEVHCHDITTTTVTDEENADTTIQIPLPFKNAIACSKDGHIIYCPGIDGSLECYSIRYGVHTIIESALRGKGKFIACSDNGHWIITGLYQEDFQLFYVEQ